MKLFEWFGRRDEPEASSRPEVNAQYAGIEFTGLDDPRLLEFMRHSVAGAEYGRYFKRLQNMALLRCVSLISEAIGMLPLNLIERGTERRVAKEHPVHRLLKVRPNGWQTPYEFKSLMQMRVLMDGNAYARILYTGTRPIAMIPLAYDRVKVKQLADWSLAYDYTRDDGQVVRLKASEMLHLRDLSSDGIVGMSRVRLAQSALEIASDAQTAAMRLFKDGVMAGGALSAPKELSDKAYARLQKSMLEKSGAENNGQFLILEEGLTAERWANTAVDAQHVENRNHQIEEIARAFGVPRPLLMMDDTSWGSGIEQLAIFFIQHSLMHWFTVWEQGVERSLLTEKEIGQYSAKYNERALMRGTLKDQADFFAKALGSGGHPAWMSQNEVRDLQDMPEDDGPTSDQLITSSNKGKTSNESPEPTRN